MWLLDLLREHTFVTGGPCAGQFAGPLDVGAAFEIFISIADFTRFVDDPAAICSLVEGSFLSLLFSFECTKNAETIFLLFEESLFMHQFQSTFFV